MGVRILEIAVDTWIERWWVRDVERDRAGPSGWPGPCGRQHRQPVGGTQTAGELAQQRDRDGRSLEESSDEPFPVKLVENHVGRGGDGRRAGLPVEQGQLADRLSGQDGAQIQTPPGRVGLSLHHDPPAIRHLVLRADHLPFQDPTHPRHRPGQRGQILIGAALEEVECAQLHCRRRHCALPAGRQRSSRAVHQGCR